jgi:hypothetical protein
MGSGAGSDGRAMPWDKGDIQGAQSEGKDIGDDVLGVWGGDREEVCDLFFCDVEGHRESAFFPEWGGETASVGVCVDDANGKVAIRNGLLGVKGARSGGRGIWGEGGEEQGISGTSVGTVSKGMVCSPPLLESVGAQLAIVGDGERRAELRFDFGRDVVEDEVFAVTDEESDAIDHDGYCAFAELV